MPSWRKRVFSRMALGATLALAAFAPALAAEPPLAAFTLIGPPEPIFNSKRDSCDTNDQPDTHPRAYRDADGAIVMFTMHTQNRALRGPSLDKLAIVCPPPLSSGGKADPAAYDDASWITATWTEDGRAVHALVHHEYQANTHPGRCTKGEYLACWYNTIVGASSRDGGRSFSRAEPPAVAAAAPFRQEIGQGRHRGFFNPSNIFADGPHRYVFISTTGWPGQEVGACLFRTTNPADPTSWRAYDGAAFSVRLGDPYRGGAGAKPCRVIEPFPAPVGAVLRHRPSGTWIAVFQASVGGDVFKQSGFYTTSSRDLLTWDQPRLLLAGRTLYDGGCHPDGKLISYPSLLDAAATGRNFDDGGDALHLWYVTLRFEACQDVGERELVRRPVAIKVWP